MVAALIFDVDGTLIDSVDAHAASWHDVFAERGFDVPKTIVRSQIGKGGDQLMPVFLDEKTVKRDGAAIEARRKEIFEARYKSSVKAFPDVRELFQRLRRDGVRLALASSAKGDELAFYKKLAGIDELVERDVSSDEAERSKPHADIFEAALQHLKGFEKEQILVVGDTPYDADAAGRAGLVSDGVLCGGFAEEDLRRAGCRNIFADPTDMLRRYDEIGIRPTG